MIFASVRQVCTVVDDFEATVTRLCDDFGIGPFRCWHFRPPMLLDTTFRGKSAAWTMKLGITWLDDVQWEVIQPVDGASLYREHRVRHGRGVQHLLMGTGSLSFEQAAAAVARKGHPFAQTARVNVPLRIGTVTLPALPGAIAAPANLRFGYIDAEATLRTSIELTRYPLGFSERFALRAGKPQSCIPDGLTNFERPLPHLRVRRVVKVAIVTRDLDATVRAWTDVPEVGPWRVFERSEARAAWAFVGETLIEIVEPAGDGPHAQVLRTRGEGVAAVGVEPIEPVADLVARLRGLGYEDVPIGSWIGGRAGVWIRARGRIGTDVEIVEPSEPLRAIFERATPNRIVS